MAVKDVIIGYAKGEKGDAATVEVGAVTTGAPGTNASVNNSGTSSNAVFDFKIPRGDEGKSATVSVGAVTTGAAGSAATVENVGTSSDAVLNFSIPKGDKGDAYPENIHGLFGYSATGTELELSPTSDFPLSKLDMYGRSDQIGTPSPESPAPIDVPGYVCKGNQLLDAHNITGDMYSADDFGTLTVTYADVREHSDLTPSLSLSAGEYCVSRDNTEGLMILDFGNDRTLTIESGGAEGTFSLNSSSEAKVKVGVYASSYPQTYKIMLNKGSEPLPYEPFASERNIKKFNVIDVNTKGGNFFNPDDIIKLTNLTYSNGMYTQKTGDSSNTNNFKIVQYKGETTILNSVWLMHERIVVGRNIIDFIVEEGADTLVIGWNGSARDSTIYIPVNGLESGKTYVMHVDIFNKNTQGSASFGNLMILKKETATIQTPTGLPGIKVPDNYKGYTYADEDGQKWVADTVEYDGDKVKYVKRIGAFNLDGSKAPHPVYNTPAGNLYGFYLDDGTGKVGAPAISNRLQSIDASFLWNNDVSRFCLFSNDSGNAIRIRIETSVIGEQSINDYLSNNHVKIYYILDSPVTTYMDQETIESLKSLRTLDKTTNMTNTGECFMDIDYTLDTRTEAEKREYINQLREILGNQSLLVYNENET